MTRLKEALIRGESSAPCGWSEDVCAALEEMTQKAEDFESWSGGPSIVLDEPSPDDQWEPREEEAVLARWDELITLLGRTLVPPARPSADPSPSVTAAAAGPPADSLAGDTATAGATHTGKRTPGTLKRRSGQKLTDAERKVYEQIVRELKKQPHRATGKKAKVAKDLGIDIKLVVTAEKWGRRHGLL
jgi:hypothetical protein